MKEIHLDKHGNMESVENIEDGTKGNNIKLTIDLAFQSSGTICLRVILIPNCRNGGAKYSEGMQSL